MQEYIDNGAALGWLIDRLNQASEMLNQPEFISGKPELTGFTLQIAKIW
jgi:Uma2 family endonuclease